MSLRGLCFILMAVAPRSQVAQGVERVGGRSEVFAGSELEDYLRVLQVSGIVPLYPWSIRSFSPRELDRLASVDSAHPWAHRYAWAAPAGSGWTLDIVRPTASLRVNSSFPYGSDDGPIWAGRGVTSAIQAGFAVRRGAVSLTVAPLAFQAANARFRLLATGDTGRLVYADALYPRQIDRPQRFGNASYASIDPGQSTLRIDAAGVSLGVSTANQYWGPAAEFPIILGNNAPGFPHAFLGTATPRSLRLLRVHGRLIWGELSQSAFSAETAAGGRRFVTGLIGVLTSDRVRGLEFGLSRFVHMPWPHGGPTLDDLLTTLRSQNRLNQAGTVTDNQLASAFIRCVFPRAALEVYGEYGREDYHQNLRHLVDEPDSRGGWGYTMGLRRVVRRPGPRLVSIRAELQHLRPPVTELALGGFYVHGTPLAQGHTQRGQILGSDAGFGGAASLVAVDVYHPRGRWTVAWSRIIRQDLSDFLTGGRIDLRALDVQHALRVDALFFRGRYDITAGLTAVYELNRNFGEDAFNLNAIVGVRADVGHPSLR